MLTNSALALASTLIFPIPPSHTKNWLDENFKKPVSRQIGADSFGTERFLNEESSASTITPVVTHHLDNLSYSLSTTLAQLDIYSTLNAGWDGEESQPPSAGAIAFAKNLLDVIPSGVSVPHPMISKNGVIGFYWSTDEAFADIEIDNENSFSIFAQRRKGESAERYLENIPLDENTPQVLADCLIPLGRI